ncbi:hypothetical protein EFP52_14830 [Lacticaseibacillus paracasei]|nr:hypothetical protein [Lacticaseibacillus paracasei]
MGLIVVKKAFAFKRVRWPRKLRVRTLDAMVKARPSRPRPLTLRFLTAPAHALKKTAPHRNGYPQFAINDR